MANFITAEIGVELDQKSVKSSLKKTENLFKKSINRMKKTVSSLVKSFKSAFSAMAKFAKIGAVAIVAAFLLVTKAAMAQEDAVFGLQAALSNTGDATIEVLRDFKDFAAALQEVTIHGDETTLGLISLIKNLGVSTGELEKATNITIGLAAATGRNAESMATYVALALQGETTMLRRYIPALRSATSKTEELQIITEFAANGMAVAEARARTTSGRLRQLWNVIGDVAERIGGPFLKNIRESAVALRDWLKDNTEQFAKFGEILNDVGERFAKFVGLVKTDPGKFLESIKKSIINISIFIGKSLLIVLTPVFQTLGQILAKVLSTELNIPFTKTQKRAKLLEQKLKIESNFLKSVEDEIKRLERTSGIPVFERGLKFLIKTPKDIEKIEGLEDLANLIRTADTLDEQILKNFPKEIEFFKILKAEELKHQLKDINLELDKFSVTIKGPTVFEQLKEEADALIASLSKDFPGKQKEDDRSFFSIEQMEEAQRLKIQQRRAVDQRIKDSIRAQRKEEQEIFEMLDKEFEELERINKERDRRAKAAADKLKEAAREAARAAELAQQKAIERAQALVTIQQDLNLQTFQYRDSLKEITEIQAKRFEELGINEDLIKSWKELRTITEQFGPIITGAQLAGEDFFTSWIDGTKSVKDAWKDMLGSMIQTLNRFIAKAVTDMILFQAIFPAISGIGGLFFGPASANRTPSLNQAAPTPNVAFAATGGIFNRPTIGGEAGPEAFVPLPDGKNIPVSIQGGEPSVIVNVINKSSQEVGAKQGESFFDGRQLVTEIILEDFNQGGQIREGIFNLSNGA